jgi:hypothetical protein
MTFQSNTTTINDMHRHEINRIFDKIIDELDVTEKKYKDSSMGNMYINNDLASYHEDLCYNDKTKYLIGYTEGLDKPNNNKYCTDKNFKDNLSLYKRCTLLYEFSLFQHMSSFNDSIKIGIERELDMDKGTCKIFRHTNKLHKSYKLHKSDKL